MQELGIERPGRLAGRRILITGGASGIGRATADLFHQQGARLALLDKDVAGLATISAQCEALAVHCDLRESTQIASVIDQTVRKLGGLDGVVNCAGVGLARSIADMDVALFSELLAVNLIAPYFLCKEAIPHLLTVRDATIVNIASATGILPNSADMTAYATTKGGLIAFTKALAAEVAPRIRVNAVCPGLTNTPMTAAAFAGYSSPSESPVLQQYALKRAAEPIEIARTVLFLTSNESSFTTGTALVVDGGRCFH